MPSSAPAPSPGALPLLPRQTTWWFLRQEVQLQLTPPVVLSERLAHLSLLQGLPIPDALSQGGWLTGGGEKQAQPPPQSAGGTKLGLTEFKAGSGREVEGYGAPITLRVN